MKSIADPSQSIPVVDRVDILVVGGGMTGVAAALSAPGWVLKFSLSSSSTAWVVSPRQAGTTTYPNSTPGLLKSAL